jgi:hypothetical protein
MQKTSQKTYLRRGTVCIILRIVVQYKEVTQEPGQEDKEVSQEHQDHQKGLILSLSVCFYLKCVNLQYCALCSCT